LKLIKIPSLLFVLAFLLTACQGATQSAPEPTAGEMPTDVLPAPTATIRTSVSETAATSGPVAAAACTVVSPQPTPGPTEQSLFPPVSADDWILGPDTAAVTIIEYSDFQ
jgi:protein-disulfide isomerase